MFLHNLVSRFYSTVLPQFIASRFVVGFFRVTLPYMFSILLVFVLIVCGICLVGTSSPFADPLSFSLLLCNTVLSRLLYC